MRNVFSTDFICKDDVEDRLFGSQFTKDVKMEFAKAGLALTSVVKALTTAETRSGILQSKD